MVTMAHARQARMCARGVRAFAKRHGLDYSRFLREGIPAEQLRATGDAMAAQAADIAEAEAER